MKRTVASLACFVVMGWVGLSLWAVGIGCKVTGLILVGPMTAMRIGESFDVRAHVKFAMPDTTGLILVTMDRLAHRLMPLLDPYVVGPGVDMVVTLRPFPCGVVVGRIAGRRAAPAFEAGSLVRR